MASILIRSTPARPKAGEEIKVQIVIMHPMEPGTRRDSKGQLIPADYISHLEVDFDGQLLARMSPRGGVSANPLFAFKMRAERSGTVRVRYRDLKGETGEKELKLTVV